MRKPIATAALIAFGAALLLMLSWGHQSSQPAEAGEETGTLVVTFEAKPPLDPSFMLGLCVEIRDGFDQALKNKACDDGQKDEDGSLNGQIQLTLDVNNPFLILKGLYSIVAQTPKQEGLFELDPGQVPGDGEAKRECDLLQFEGCDITFSYRSQFELDPYKCYSAFGFPSVREWVFLADQFDGKEAWVDRPVALCNPAFKEELGSNGGAAGNFVDDDNLVCFRLRQEGPEPGRIFIANQFGEQELDVGRAERLCVRSEKGSETNPGSAGLGGIVPNFKCYKARRASGSPSIGSNTVLVGDQYDEKVTRVFWPVSLCAPVDKQTNSMSTGEAAGEPGSVLVCYRVFQRISGLRFEIVQNQFGTQLMLLYRAESLCVPSGKIAD